MVREVLLVLLGLLALLVLAAPLAQSGLPVLVRLALVGLVAPSVLLAPPGLLAHRVQPDPPALRVPPGKTERASPTMGTTT
jgi:hypothetical protein